MTRLRELNYREVIERLRKIGFRFYRQGKGSHELWVRSEDGRAIPVPRHEGRAIRKGTLKAIIRETGLSVDEFLRL